MSTTSILSPSRTLDFCLSLTKAHAALVRRFDGCLGTLHGVSFSDFVLLLQLSRAPGERLRRVDLAEKLGLTASAVTRALIPLERIGLVKRQRDLHDARVGYAVITKSGQRVLHEAMSSAELVSEALMGARNESQLNPLSELLMQLSG